MKAKTIKKVLRKVADDFIESITDVPLRARVREDLIITGGSIASMLLKEDVNDYDFYFRTYRTALAVAQYYAKDFPEVDARYKIEVGEQNKEDGKTILVVEDIVGVESYIESNGIYDATHTYDIFNKDIKFQPIFFSSNAITLSDKVQIVTRFCGEPEELHKNFDFVHCTNYYDYAKHQLTLNPKALESLLTKELIYIGSLYPVCSIIRTRKFVKRNWTINAGQYLKMAFQVSQLDLTDIEVLREQLIGVDSAYFSMLISALASQKEKDADFKVTSSYVAEIVEKIF